VLHLSGLPSSKIPSKPAGDENLTTPAFLMPASSSLEP